MLHYSLTLGITNFMSLEEFLGTQEDFKTFAICWLMSVKYMIISCLWTKFLFSAYEFRFFLIVLYHHINWWIYFQIIMTFYKKISCYTVYYVCVRGKAVF
jgi:hypothetical protein